VTANSVDTFGHLAVTALAPVDGIGGGRSQLVIEKGQGCVKGRRKDFCQGVAHPLEPFDPLPQLRELIECALGAAAAVKQGLEVIPDVP
jgi:hypothetical protein